MKQEKYSFHCNNQYVIHLCKNFTFYFRSEHIDVRYHWVRNVLDSKLLTFEKDVTPERKRNKKKNLVELGRTKFGSKSGQFLAGLFVHFEKKRISSLA